MNEGQITDNRRFFLRESPLPLSLLLLKRDTIREKMKYKLRSPLITTKVTACDQEIYFVTFKRNFTTYKCHNNVHDQII